MLFWQHSQHVDKDDFDKSATLDHVQIDSDIDVGVSKAIGGCAAQPCPANDVSVVHMFPSFNFVAIQP